MWIIVEFRLIFYFLESKRKKWKKKQQPENQIRLKKVTQENS